MNPEVIKPPPPKNKTYYLFGLGLIFLNKIRHSIKGYTNPRTFEITEYRRAIEYDFHVFNHWLKYLGLYTGISPDIKGKTILELGPGADLGIGLITLLNGAKRYNAIDVNNLVELVPEGFYLELFKFIKDKYSTPDEILDYLSSQLRMTQKGENDRLNYIVSKDFDLSVFQDEEIDLVLSQAAFEHFDDIGKTIAQLSRIVKQEAVLITEIDLKTHTRWIRDLDPLNIYRYNQFIYELFKFSGSPNRLRPFEYQNILEKHGWSKIQITPLTVVEKQYLTKINDHLTKRFREPINQMDYLTIMLCATKT